MKKLFILFIAFPFFAQAQVITTIAGNDTAGYTGDGALATYAQLNLPQSIAIDSSGNIYIADGFNNCIRKVNTTGYISTIAGTGTAGYTGDGGLATAAELYHPAGIILHKGYIYFTEQLNNCVRRIDASGTITTIAGTGVTGTSGDGGLATAAELNYPMGIVFDSHENLYVGEYWGQVIRKIDTLGIISTFAGTGVSAYSGDGGPATEADLHGPDFMIIDSSDNIYFADDGNQCIRKISNTGIISKIAGSGVAGYNGDGISANTAELNYPGCIAFDHSGNLYITDFDNNRIRMVDTTGIIHTVVGDGVQGFYGDGGSPTSAEINNPSNVLFDKEGNLFVTDRGNSTIRKIGYSALQVRNTTVNNTIFTLFPNPNNGIFTIKGNISTSANGTISVQVNNVLGQEIYSSELTLVNGSFNDNIVLDRILHDGIYYVNIISGNTSSTLQMTIEK